MLLHPAARQLLHLSDQLLEHAHRLLDRFRRGHIDARFFQDVDGEVAAAALQEAEVAVNRRRALLQNLFGEAGRSREARRVFVHIEAVVEMRDARPFHLNVLIHNHAGTIIF